MGEKKTRNLYCGFATGFLSQGKLKIFYIFRYELEGHNGGSRELIFDGPSQHSDKEYSVYFADELKECVQCDVRPEWCPQQTGTTCFDVYMHFSSIDSPEPTHQPTPNSYPTPERTLCDDRFASERLVEPIG